MKTASCLFVIALLVGSAAAQGPLALVHHKGKGEPLITVPQKEGPTTSPLAVNESDRRKQCPAGFEFVGKQCARTLTAQADIVCPSGTSLVDGKCAKYVGKLSECPAGYQAADGTCIKTLTSEPEIVCPEGFVLSGKDSCVRKVALPDQSACPAGSIAKGDICVRSALEAPDFVCPGGYALEGKSCRREETFDCTPARNTLPALASVAAADGKDSLDNHGWTGLRRDGGALGKGDTARYTLNEAAPIVEEYVISETCKRIITEPARRICRNNGLLDGKLCRVDVPVEHILRKGGFKDEFIPSLRQCPIGFNEAGPAGECQATEEVLPALYCPYNTVDLGARCGIYTHPRTVCPHGFSLEGKHCVKTIFAAPIVEFTVTYSCTGKNCGDHEHHSKGY